MQSQTSNAPDGRISTPLRGKRGIFVLAVLVVISMVTYLRPVSTGQLLGIYSEKNVIKPSDQPEGITFPLDAFPTEDSVTEVPVQFSLEALQRCRCQKADIDRQHFIIADLFRVIPWLNITTEEHLRRHHPNLPIDLIKQMTRKGQRMCHLMPSLSSIQRINTYWQEARLNSNTTFYVYSSIFDNRTTTAEKVGPCLRVLGVYRGPVASSGGWCHLWYSLSKPPVVSHIIRRDYIDWQKTDRILAPPYMLTCQVPPDLAHIKPVAVSIVDQPCARATNLVQVEGSGQVPSLPDDFGDEGSSKNSSNNRVPDAQNRSSAVEKPLEAAVCGPAIYYYHDDWSSRLVEWMEMLRARGIAKVFLYETDVHPNIQKVLRFYEEEGFLHVTKYTYPPPYINEPSTRRLWTNLERARMWSQENIYFTDCLLRHMHEYRFIAHYDPDELPILVAYPSYPAMVRDLLKKSYSNLHTHKKPLPVGYKLHWRFFYNDVHPPRNVDHLPKYLHMMRHTLVETKKAPDSVGNYKQLYDMERVTAVFSHEVLYCTEGKCSSGSQTVDETQAYLAHFSRNCGIACKKVGATTEEPSLRNNEREIMVAVMKVLVMLNLI